MTIMPFKIIQGRRF